MKWATPEVVSFPSQEVFKQQILANHRLDGISPLGISGVSQPAPSLTHIPLPLASPLQARTSHLSVFNHTAPSAEMSMSPFYSWGLQTVFIDLSASHTPSKFGDLSSALPCHWLFICFLPHLFGNHLIARTLIRPPRPD